MQSKPPSFASKHICEDQRLKFQWEISIQCATELGAVLVLCIVRIVLVILFQPFSRSSVPLATHHCKLWLISLLVFLLQIESRWRHRRSREVAMTSSVAACARLLPVCATAWRQRCGVGAGSRTCVRRAGSEFRWPKRVMAKKELYHRACFKCSK